MTGASVFSYWKRLMRIGAAPYRKATPGVAILGTNGFQWEVELYHPTGKARYNVSPL